MKKLLGILVTVFACLPLVHAQAAALNRDIKCSDDGRVCLECFYKDNGDLLYCDIWILPKVSSAVFERAQPLRGKMKSFSVRSASRVRGAINGMLPDELLEEEVIEE